MPLISPVGAMDNYGRSRKDGYREPTRIINEGEQRSYRSSAKMHGLSLRPLVQDLNVGCHFAIPQRYRCVAVGGRRVSDSHRGEGYGAPQAREYQHRRGLFSEAPLASIRRHGSALLVARRASKSLICLKRCKFSRPSRLFR